LWGAKGNLELRNLGLRERCLDLVGNHRSGVLGAIELRVGSLKEAKLDGIPHIFGPSMLIEVTLMILE
jgi:hypothetical protein